MLIKSDDLARHLARAQETGAIDPVWVVVDEEPLTAIEAVDALRQSATALSYLDRETFAFTATSDWSPLIASVASVSLFDDKKLVILRMLSSGPGVKGAKVLEEFLGLIPTLDTTLVIIHLTNVDYKTKKAAWYQALTKIANVITCEPVVHAQYPRWVQKRLALQNQSMSSDALAFFIEQTEGNLMAAKQELTKLSYLYPERELTIKEVTDSVMNVSRYSIDDLVEAVANADVARVTRTIAGMQAEGEALPLIIMRLSGLIREAWTTREGQTPFAAPAMKALLRQMAMRLTAKKFDVALSLCADIDRLAKGLTVYNRNDVWSELKKLCVFLAHTPRKNS